MLGGAGAQHIGRAQAGRQLGLARQGDPSGAPCAADAGKVGLACEAALAPAVVRRRCSARSWRPSTRKRRELLSRGGPPLGAAGAANACSGVVPPGHP